MKLLLVALCVAAVAADPFSETNDDSKPIFHEPEEKESLNSWAKMNFNMTWDALFNVTASPNNAYTYSQSSGRFNGGGISVTGCSGRRGNCRNNPSCQCQRNVGPLPRGNYRIGGRQTFRGMVNSYALAPAGAAMCGRSGFLIHGGGCQADPSEGCIVISDAGTRGRIVPGGTLTVTN
jgi:hypothetical protein